MALWAFWCVWQGVTLSAWCRLCGVSVSGLVLWLSVWLSGGLLWLWWSLVWREVNDEMDIAPDFSVFKDKDLIDELRKRGYTISVTDQNSIPVSTNSMFEYPCKIGDPVYIIDHDENNKLKIYKGKWKRVSLIQDKKDQAFELRGEVVYDIYDTFYNDGRTMKHGMYVGQIGTRIGERIFLKEKDAEEALALLNS